MSLKLYNSLSKTTETFKPLNAGKVLMYVCGITPYDTTHLGHAFTYIFYDVLQRYLQFSGLSVEYTQNVTDIDDDILKRAKEVNTNWIELGNTWTERFLTDMKSLNMISPTNYVKATDTIDKIIEIVESLQSHNYAYERQGNVYFDFTKYKSYGELSGFDKETMIDLSKERGANPEDPLKNDPLDFLLWQRFKVNEPFWESPWGKGRPGWHIECSAMIHKTLGSQIDIHGGGYDLIFPHHESERAQSESFTHKSPFVQFWVHTAMLEYQGEKMSKSLGNLVMVSDLLKNYFPNIIRWVLLSHHYRKPWEYYDKEIKDAKESVNMIENSLKDFAPGSDELNHKLIDQFKQLMENDLDTPKVLNLLENIAKQIDSEKDSKEVEKLKNTLYKLYQILGFKM